MFRRQFILLALISALVGWSAPTALTTLRIHWLPLALPGLAPSIPMSMPITPSPGVGRAIAGPVALAPLPSVQTQYHYYAITGSTATELRSQLNQHGPLSPLEGRRYDANTQWSVHWTYHYRLAGSHCAIATADTSVDIAFTLPRWEHPTSDLPALTAEWQRYMGALQRHEDGHRDTALAAAQAVSQTLSQFPAYASCGQLQTAVDTALQGVIAQHNQRDIDYDRTTQHGRTQGAVFPSQAIALN